MSRVTTFVLVLGTAALAGTGVYLPQQRQLQRVRAEYHELAARQARLIAERDEAANTAWTAKIDLDGLQVDRTELARLRAEVAKLRETLKQRASQTTSPAAVGKAAIKPGGYLTKEQLVFAGYATPEAALESMTWALITGDYDQSLASLGPELQLAELSNEQGRAEFEDRRQVKAPLFKGMQILASKMLAEDLVELKVKIESNPVPGYNAEIPSLLIQPMIKIGTEWKLGNAERAYDSTWDQDSQAEPQGP